MLDLDLVRNAVAGPVLVRDVRRLERGPIALTTVLTYPDGHYIEVYLPKEATAAAPIKLTDFGQTTGWLFDALVKPWRSKTRQTWIADIIAQHGVTYAADAFEIPLERLDELPSAVLRLGQVCLRVADLMFTRRWAVQTTFGEDFEESLADFGLPYAVGGELIGRFKRPVRVDYLVEGAKTRSAVLTLAASGAPQAHTTANEIFARWSDLDIPGRKEQRVTVFDDRQTVYRDDDMERLATQSVVIAASNRPLLRDVLAA